MTTYTNVKVAGAFCLLATLSLLPGPNRAGWNAAPAEAQQAQGTQAMSEADAASIEALGKLSFLLGEWSGTSTAMVGPGSEASSDVTEKVTMKAGGTVLMLEGRGTMEENGETRVIHDALGLVTWDPVNETYEMRAFRAGGGWTDSELVLDGHTLRWGMETPNGTLRFTLDFSEEGRWYEIGEIERGGQWFRFLEMDLRRR